MKLRTGCELAVLVSVLFTMFYGNIAKAQQETAAVVGTVTDTTGAIVPDATVTITNVQTNINQASTTSSTGDYAFNLLQVGTYSIRIESKGFKAFSAPSIALSAGDRVRVDAKLEVGDITQTIEVSASLPALKTDTSNIGSLVPSQSVQALPLNGRNLIKLVQLTPGVTEGAPGSIVAGNRPDDRRLTSSFSVNGQTDTMNNNLIDGMDNNERIIGTIGVRPSIDAVQEVNIETNKYDASLGRTGGGVVDVITKAGTNSYHGTAYEYFRNKVLNTNPNYNFTLATNPAGAAAPYNKCPTAAACPSAPNPAFRQNQWGGSVGGPIKKNKTFFFGDYEGYSQGVGTTAALYTVPTLCERGLNLAKLQGFTGSSISCPDNPNVINPGDFSDIKTISPVGGGSVQGGAGPLIPVASQTVLGLSLFSLYPLPNTGGAAATTNNFTSAPERIQNSNTWDVRVDEHFSDKDSFYARFTHNGLNSTLPTGFPDVHIDPTTGLPTSSGGVLVHPSVIAFSGQNTEAQNHFALSYVHVFNSNIVINLKAGVLRSVIDSEPPNEGSNVSNKLGFPCNPTACINAGGITPGIVGSGLVNEAFTAINGSTVYTTVGDSGFIPLREYDTSFQYMGTLNWNKGPHSLRMGLSLIRRRATIGQSSAPNGTFSFSGTYTGVAGGDLLEGIPYQVSRNNALDQPGFRTWEPSGYIQDDWRATPWLTINLGLRYDIFTAYTEVHGRISNYNPYLGLVVSPSIPGIQQSSPTADVPTPLTDWAPRVGFSASLPHNSVLRGGFGLTFFPVNYESPYYMKNAPFNFAATCSIQNAGHTANQCDTAQLGTAATGQFANNLPASAAQYGLATTNSASTVNQAGGALMAASEPVPILNIALATNTANYRSNGTIAAIPINLRENYLEQFNMEFQKQFGANVVNIGYVGQIGRHVAPLNSNTNQNLPANPSENAPTKLPMVVGGQTLDFGTLLGFPYFNGTGTGAAEEASIGTSMYNALQTAFVRRFSRGLTVNFNYVWAHMTDNVDGSRACVLSMFSTPEPCFYDTSKGAGPGLPAPATATTQDCANASTASCLPIFGWQKADWGNGAQDVRDRLSWGVNYEFPFAKSAHGVEAVLAQGWSANTSGSWQTGLPFNVTPATSTTNIVGSGYLDQVCSGKSSNASLQQWFNVNCFNHPQTSTLGLMRPNQLFGPSQTRFDLSIVKQFALPRESMHLEFRTEIFNLFNTPNFNTPSGTSLAYTNNTTVNVGGTATPAAEITAMNSNWNQREIQFALRFAF